MSFEFIKKFSSQFYNTGGGKTYSKTYHERAEKNKKLVIQYCNKINLKPKKILEIGFGKYPRCLELLDIYYSPFQIFGLEKSHYKFDSKIKTFNDFKELPKDIKFDLIYTIDVLEHVPDPELFNEKVLNFCKKDSFIFHSIDLTSHYHGSKSINAFKHYIYKDKLWESMTNNRSSFTNRIRANHWHEIFDKHFNLISFETIEHPLKEQILNNFKSLGNHDVISRVNVAMKAS